MKRNFRIALYGPAGSGKDYLCKKIMADSPSTHRYAFADAMKIGIADILGFQDCFRKAITDNESEHFKDNYCIDLGTLKVYPATHPSDNSMKYVSASELYEMKKHDINMKYFAPENKYNNVYIMSILPCDFIVKKLLLFTTKTICLTSLQMVSHIRNIYMDLVRQGKISLIVREGSLIILSPVIRAEA